MLICLSLGTLTYVHHSDWLTYSGGSGGEFCYNFSISNNLTQIVNLPTRIPNCDSVSIDFPINSKQDALFHRVAYDYSHADWDGLGDHLRDVLWEGTFKLNASPAASEFCESVQVGFDVYIPHRKYQVKPHSSPSFSAACAAAIVHRSHFFCTNRINLLNLK